MILIGALLRCPLPVFGASIPELVKDLGARDFATRSAAREALLKAGPAAVKDLLPELAGPRRFVAQDILARMGTAIVPELIKQLGDPSVRIPAGNLLVEVAGPFAQNQTSKLLKCLKDPELKHFCGQALGKVVDSRSGGRVAELSELVKSKDRDIRFYAIVALGQIGPKARKALEVLQAATQDRDGEVAQAASAAIGKIKGLKKPA